MEDEKEYINLIDIKGIPHQLLFDEVAKVISEDTVDIVNKNDKIVHYKETFYVKYIKRMFDVIVSGIILLLVLPINFILMILTYFDVGSPIIFKQKRVGKNGKLFNLVKFRNMTNEKNELGSLLPAEQRVTKLGKFVRKTSLDELLNFWSIFKGDMSLIGPRPLAIQYNDRYSERHKRRTDVKPGLECPRIHNTKYGNTWTGQFENDIYYVENISFILDLKMCLALVSMVFNKNSSNMRGSANRGCFVGYNKDGSSINSLKVPKYYVDKAIENIKNKQLFMENRI